MAQSDLLREVRVLEGRLNRRIYGLENTKQQSADTKRWERYLKDFASGSTGTKNAERFHIYTGEKTGKELENTLKNYKQKLEYAMRSKSRVKDINESYRKAKATFEKKFGGRKMTWKQYHELTQWLDNADVTYIYQEEKALEQLNNKRDYIETEKIGDRKFYDNLLDNLKNERSFTQIIDKEIERGNYIVQF